MKVLLPELPAGWTRSRLDHEASVNARIGWKALTASEYMPEGVIFLSTPNIKGRDIEFENTNFITEFRYEESPELKLQPGDVLLAKDGNTLGITNIVTDLPGPSTVNGSIAVLRSRSLEARFFRYVLASDAIQGLIAAVKAGMGVPHLFQADIKKFPIPKPPPPVQTAIADFLDRETGRIDSLVEKKRRLIELLEEKRTALISHVVTKGLDPTVPMKESGIPWLGEIPAHWEVTPLMHLIPPKRKIMYGIVLPGPNVEEGIPIIKSGDVKPGRLDPGRLDRTTHEIESRYVRSRVFPGDIVYSIRGSVGSAEIVPDSLPMANLTQDAARVAPAPDGDRHWLLYVLRASVLFQQLESSMWGAAVKGVNIKDLKRLLVPTPSTQEQEEIGRHLGRAVTRIDALEQKVARQLDLLAEYRQALITAAVTGQIDVDAAAPDPEEALA